jgi:hypothetical protein
MMLLIEITQMMTLQKLQNTTSLSHISYILFSYKLCEWNES